MVRPFTDDDVEYVEDLAGRAGLAVDNARLFGEHSDRAEQLQRALLPDLPSSLPGVSVASRYLPADDGDRVGGDWYDAFQLPDDSIALVIGDVAGHDLHAATRMGAIRHKLRAIAGDRMAPPSEIVERLDAILRKFAPDDIATVIYMRLVHHEDGRMRIEWTNAGHLPPILISAVDDTPTILDTAVGLPLGVGNLERSDDSIRVEPGSTLVLYTDGLVERRGEALDLNQLVNVLEPLASAPLEQICNDVVTALKPTGQDDVAMLAVRIAK
jgi:serine phosphatase RsbU (regulator of sigma subunit)